MYSDNVYRSQLNPENLTLNPKEFYEKLQEYVKDFGYYFDNTKYKFKEGKNEIDFVSFTLECKREVDDYTQFEIIIDVTFEHVKKTKDTINGAGKIILASRLNMDYDNRWQGNPFLSLMQGIYKRYIYFPTYKKYSTMLAVEMEQVEQRIKKYIKVHEAKVE